MGKLAMVDSGHRPGWRPSTHIRRALRRTQVDYLFITNADQDHLSDLNGLSNEGVRVVSLTRNPHPPPADLRRIKAAGGPLTDDLERYLDMHETFVGPVAEPFDAYMGGISASHKICDKTAWQVRKPQLTLSPSGKSQIYCDRVWASTGLERRTGFNFHQNGL